MKTNFVILISLFVTITKAQVGINTTTPNASLEIRSENQANPSNTEGILIPKIDAFPATNPTAAQQGMMVYLTTTNGSNIPGFYYWDNISLTWKPVGNEQDRDFLKVGTSEASTNILDNKYTFGNNGFGTTTPTRRLHVSNGVSGAVSSGSTGILLESNANVYQHFLTPSTAENGLLFGTDTNSLGSGIIYNNVSNPDGFQFRAGGNFTRMTLTNTGNLGIGTGAPTRRLHVANGISGATSNTNAGVVVESNGNVFQHFLSPSTAENGILFGTDTNSIGSGLIFNNASTLNGLQFRTGGNATRMTLTNSGNLGLNTVNPSGMLDLNANNRGILIPRVALTSTMIAAPVINPNGGAIVESTLVYNTASAGTAPNNVVPGFYYWTGTKWNKFDIDEKNKHYTAVGNTNIISPFPNVGLMPQMEITFTSKSSVVFVDFSASGFTSNAGICVSFDLMLNGSLVKRFQTITTQITNPIAPFFAFGSLYDIHFNYPITLIPDTENTISINWTSTHGTVNNNAATPSSLGGGYGAHGHRMLNVLDPQGGGGVVSPTPVPTANDIWRINGNSGTVAGTNYLGTNDNQALVLKTNNTEHVRLSNTGNLGIGTQFPTQKLTIVENNNSTTNAQMSIVQQGTGDAMVFLSTPIRTFNFGVDASDDNFKISASPGFGNLTTGTLLTLESTGNLGVGTNNPAQKLHVSGPAGLTAVRIGNTSGTGATSNVALDFFRNTAANTDWRIYNIGANLTVGNSGDDLVTVNDLYQYQGVRFIPMNDATQNLGQAANRWNTVFASNGTINTSDAREKKNIENLNYGLTTLMQLRPVSFEWKKDDGSGIKLGLIAQELQQVVPEVVRDWDWEEDEQGNRKKVASPILGVYYSDLIPVLIKATQEQQMVIEQQKEEIELLKQHLQEQYQVLLERIKKIEEK